MACVIPAVCPPSPVGNLHTRNTSEGSSNDIKITTLPAVAVATVTFNTFGGAVLAFTHIDVNVDPAVLPLVESRPLRVTIGQGGIARMCDPDVLLSSSDPRKC